MTHDYDTLERRCPKLGHFISFHYCRSLEEGLCLKIVDCWWEMFDVVSYLSQNGYDKELAMISQKPPKQKLTNIIEQIYQAKRRLT